MATALPFSPHQPREKPKSGSMEKDPGYERHLCSWRDAIIKQGASELETARDLQEVNKYIDYLEGNWWGTDRANWRSSFNDNYLADQRIESLSALTDIKPVVDISCKIEDYQHQGDIAHKVLRHEWLNNSMDLRLVELIDHALFGTGFWKVVAYEPGVLDVSSHALGQVLPVQMPGNQLQGSAAVVHRSFQSLAYFVQKFGVEKCKGLERYSVDLMASMEGGQWNRPDNIPEYQWSTLSPAMKRRMHLSRNASRPEKGYPGATFRPYPIIECQEIYHDDISTNDYGYPILVKHPDLAVAEHNYHYIVQPGGRLYPRKRLTVFAGDRVMYDGPSPFWDGLYPFIMLQLNPCVWAPGGISKYRNLVPLVQCVAEGTPIWCPDGTIRPVEEVVESKLDVLTFEDGKVIPTTPTKWHDNGIQDTVKVTFASGRIIYATNNHRWLYRKLNGNRRTKICTTDQLEVGMQIPMPKECPYFGERLGETEGYLLGALNGDGCVTTSCPKFCAIPGDGVHEAFRECVTAFGDRFSTGQISKPSGLTETVVSKLASRGNSRRIASHLCDLLREEGLHGHSGDEKNLPKQGYSRQFYLGYVAGLFDTDGCVTSHTVTFSNISERMVRQLSDILLKFGVYSWVWGPYKQIQNQLPSGCNPENCKPVWRLTVSDRNSVIKFAETFRFRHLRKQEKLQELVIEKQFQKSKRGAVTSRKWNPKKYCDTVRHGTPEGFRMDRITALEDGGKRQTYCVTVEPSHLWMVNGYITLQSLNRIGAGVDDTVIDAVNRNVVSRKGAIDPVSWDRFDPSRPKQKILLMGTADPSRDFRYMDAKQLPAYVEMWLKYLDMRIGKKSGSLDISGLARKKQAPGGDTIASMQDAMSGPFRLEARYVEEALRQAAIMAVSRIFQFYTLDQRLRLLGPDGQTWEDFDYQAQSMIPAHAPKEDHWKMFSVSVAPGSMHGATDAMKRQIAVILRRTRDISRAGLYSALNLGLNVDEETSRLAKEAAENPQPPGPQGKVPRMSRSQRTGSPI